MGLIVASAISGGFVLAGAAYTMHAILSCDDTTFADEPCTERAYVAGIAFLIGHKVVADLGTGLAAGAGWHWSRWRQWQGRQRDSRRYKDIAFWGATVFGMGVAAEIIGAGLLAHLNWGKPPAAENEDQLPTAIVASLGTGALLRIIGAGLATFGWGGQKWLEHGSGRVPRRKRGRLSP